MLRRGVLLLSLGLLSLACSGKRAAGPLRQEAYVWQRTWNPAVQDSVRQARGFAELVVLAAEVDLRSENPRVARVPLDATLKTLGKPVGAALRVSEFPGLFAQKPGVVRLLEALIREVKTEARTKGIRLSEIQIDYDCPESKLADYRDVLPHLRRAASPLPLTITVLPSWMRHRRAFRTLIEETDGYVLQLHSLILPRSPDEQITMIEPTSARGWVEEAARFGRSFHVALPTHGYTAAIDEKGELVGLLAEGPLFSWSPGVTVRTVRSDPAAMAGLIRGWTRDRPSALAGVIWFRLPVAGERLNWPWPTLRTVMAGRAPQPAVRLLKREPEPGLVEIDLLNAGEAAASWPATVRVRWRGRSPIAADGLAVYRVVPVRDGEIHLEGSGSGLLRPGERRPIAWLRFAARTEVEIDVP
jgi:Protein of unknown function (DUF3142)